MTRQTARTTWPALLVGATGGLAAGALTPVLGIRSALLAVLPLGLALLLGLTARWGGRLRPVHLLPGLLLCLALATRPEAAGPLTWLPLLAAPLWTLAAVVTLGPRHRDGSLTLRWEPDDIFLGALLLALATALLGWARPVPLAVLVATVAVLFVFRRLRGGLAALGAALAALLPDTARRRTRWLLAEPHGWGPRLAWSLLAADAYRGRAVPRGLPDGGRWSLRRWLDAAWLTAAQGPARHQEAAWRLAMAAASPASERPIQPAAPARLAPAVRLEWHAELAELAFRTGRHAEAVAQAEAAIGLAGRAAPTHARRRLEVHLALVRSMALSRLGRTLEAEALLLEPRIRDADGVDARLLTVLAEALIALARQQPAGVVDRLRQQLSWSGPAHDPVEQWWRSFAQVLAAEAALAQGDTDAAERYAAGAALDAEPPHPLAALLLAEARRRRGDRSGTVEALGWAVVQGGEGPYGRQAAAEMPREPDGG